MINTSASDKRNLALHVKEVGKLKIWIVRFHVAGLCRNYSWKLVSYMTRLKYCIDNWSVNGAGCVSKYFQAEKGYSLHLGNRGGFVKTIPL